MSRRLKTLPNPRKMAEGKGDWLPELDSNQQPSG